LENDRAAFFRYSSSELLFWLLRSAQPTFIETLASSDKQRQSERDMECRARLFH
jgi:hypothetical protein